jgi:methyl-accepting chemotaxis protein WspA
MNMLERMSLQSRMIAAFTFMGLIIFIVALFGSIGNHRLSDRLSLLTDTASPAVLSLWKVNEGQTQIQSSERNLTNPRLDAASRKQELDRIERAYQQIDDGLEQYQNLEVPERQKEIFQDFLLVLQQWKNADRQFLEIHEEYQAYGLPRAPGLKMVELIANNQENSPEMAQLRAANEVLERLNQFHLDEVEPAFHESENILDNILSLNEDLVEQVSEDASAEIAQTRSWAVLGMLIGPLTAIILGWYFSRTIAKPLGNKIISIVRVAERIAEGDLTTSVRVSDSPDEIGRLQSAFYNMTRKLNSLIRQVQHSGIQITSSTTQIAASGKQLEATVTQQVASTNQVVATAKQIAATASELVVTMEQVKELSHQTTIAAGNGQQDLLGMEETMRQLSQGTSSIAAKLGAIGEKANRIDGIVTTITKVADRTNLLSLNAAIEAEKAGEYGSGFAVVAREIRRLAASTAIATLDIEQMVKDMQSAVSTGVMEMDKFTKEVARAVENIQVIGAQMSEIIERVQSLTPRFESVSQGMEGQSEGARQISAAMVQLSEASGQTAQALSDTNRAIEQLNDAARGLQGEIARFKLSG